MILKNTNRMKKMLARGFTLVELLIVIGLLGAIAVIVIAAINPIEQANRARDAKFKADASQIISGIDRYFAVQGSFPWQDCSGCSSVTADLAFTFTSAGTPAVGLCGETGCGEPGLLVTNDELKNEFLSRAFIKGISDADHGTNTIDKDQKIYIGKGAGSSSSVYACFIPKAKSTREKAIADGTVRSLSFTNGIIDVTTACDTGASATGWTDLTCMVCVPE